MKLRLFLTTALLMTISSICTAQEAYAVYTPDNNGTLTFYYDKNRNQMDGETFSLNSPHSYPIWHDDKKFEKVVFTPSFGEARPTTTNLWFADQDNLKTVEGIDQYLNTEQVIDMSEMFFGCSKLANLDVSHFKTNKVTNMRCMFYNCPSLTNIDVSSFNTSNVTNMSYMFYNCKSFTRLNVSHFDTSNVTNMSYMFYDCELLTSLDASHFDTSNVTDMRCMFNGCQFLTNIDVSSFDTSNVTDMYYMFYDCHSLTSLDLSSFNTQKVVNFSHMFHNCVQLTTIYAGYGWVINNDNGAIYLFGGCSSLVGGQGSAYVDLADTHSDMRFAHVDGGEDNPGFFTEKKYGLKVSNNVYEREVTSMNCNNILGNTSAVYTPRTHTLTLNGGTFGSYRKTALTVTEDFDEDYSLNIELNGKNTFNSDPYYGIVSNRSLWITGNGSIKGDGINMVNGNLWINDCTLDVKSIYATNTEKTQSFWMRGTQAKVSLKSNIYGFDIFNLEEDDGLMILVPEYGYYDTVDQYVKDGYGNDITGGVVIGNPNGIATGIDKVQSSKFIVHSSKDTVQSSKFKVQSSKWYTLDGKVVKTPLKGQLYIRGGKKVICK